MTDSDDEGSSTGEPDYHLTEDFGSTGEAGEEDDSGTRSASARTASTDAEIDREGGEHGESTESTPVLYELQDGCTVDDVEEGEVYRGTVNATVEYGAFVSLNSSVSGLVHESSITEPMEVGEDVKVRVSDVKADGDVELVPVYMHDYDVETVESTVEVASPEIEDLGEHEGSRVAVEGRVKKIRQTSGPTLFTLEDTTGTVEAAAFEAAGVRAYPEVTEGDVVEVTGEVEPHDGDLQIEARSLVVLEGDDAAAFEERVDEALLERAEPPELQPLVDSTVLQELYPELREVAQAIRRAVHEERPIVVRHHADADGIGGGVAVERAVLELVDDVNDDPDAGYHLFNRMPSKAPFYEMEDLTRDLTGALRDHERHGHPLPLLLLIDNGSTEEDIPAYEIADAYDIPVYVVDHHSPDEAVEEHVEAHVNPYRVGGDYAVTSGMICTELARLVNPDVEDEIRHVPAVCGNADRSEADAMEDYLELALREGYSSDDVEAISKALDYESFHLKYNDGRHLVDHILDVVDNTAHVDLVDRLSTQADEAFERQKSAAVPAVERKELDNGVLFCRFDVENHTQKFTFPGPGKTTGAVHDEIVEEQDRAVVTVGYGPDFCVVRGHGVEIDIPEIISELQVEVKGAAVDGGGHLVVGTVKFVQGLRERVLEAFESKVEEAPLKK